MYEVGNVSKNGVAAAVRLGYFVAVFILLQYLARFLLIEQCFSFKVHTH